MTLPEFLVKAKINTYAGAGEGGETDLADGSREFVYEVGEWKYRDRYFGSKEFAGEEVVWQEEKAVWAMNYYGRIISAKVSSKEIYEFLKKALRLIDAARPFRGPADLQEGEWSYKDESAGAVKKFSGIEAIYFQGEKVYELTYHGGAIAK